MIPAIVLAVSPSRLDRPRAAEAFALDPAVVHLNHGSFGAVPIAVRAAQDAIRARLEAATMRWFVLDHERELDAARAAAAGFVGADADGFVFVPNATHGIATALAHLARAGRLGPGDDLVTTDHAYRACRNALDRTAAAAGARVEVVHLPLPVRDAADAAGHVARIAERVGPRTRAVLVDHVTSPTALVLDVAALARALPAGVALIVDGAHAPGQLALDVAATGATFYTGNFHKWTCAPKGTAFLWIAPAARDDVQPLVTSHGATLPTTRRSRFRLEHDWTGTTDPSGYLAVPAEIAHVAALGGDWDAVRAGNHALAIALRDDLAAALDADPIVAPAAAGAATGSMQALALALPDGAHHLDVERALLERGVELPIVEHPATPWPLARLSAHLYNQRADAARAADALRGLGVRGRRIL